MSSGEITVLVRYTAQPGKRERARNELQELIRLVLEEEGCGGITLHQGLTGADELLLIEHWADAAIFLGPHGETPHLRSFIARAGEFLAGPPEISLWSVGE